MLRCRFTPALPNVSVRVGQLCGDYDLSIVPGSVERVPLAFFAACETTRSKRCFSCRAHRDLAQQERPVNVLAVEGVLGNTRLLITSSHSQTCRAQQPWPELESRFAVASSYAGITTSVRRSRLMSESVRPTGSLFRRVLLRSPCSVASRSSRAIRAEPLRLPR